MPGFIETIRFEKGKYHLLDLHQQRLEKAFLCHFPQARPHDLRSALPRLEYDERYKVRVVYSADHLDIEFSQYIPRHIREIRIVESETIDYAHKYEDRSELQELFDRREAAEEILIIKNGWVTDSFYANVALWDGNGWYTPRTYLLNGVQRQNLLGKGVVKERDISPHELHDYQKVSLINALNGLEECVIETRHIKNVPKRW